MRAISLWQPWATAIALGLKQVETRHWTTTYRGPLAIHAAKRWGPDEREIAGRFGFDYDERLRRPPLGAIVATCRLVSVHRTEDMQPTEMEEDFGNFASGRFGWVLADVSAIFPVPWKGAQGFFEVPDERVSVAA